MIRERHFLPNESAILPADNPHGNLRVFQRDEISLRVSLHSRFPLLAREQDLLASLKQFALRF